MSSVKTVQHCMGCHNLQCFSLLQCGYPWLEGEKYSDIKRAHCIILGVQGKREACIGIKLWKCYAMLFHYLGIMSGRALTQVCCGISNI